MRSMRNKKTTYEWKNSLEIFLLLLRWYIKAYFLAHFIIVIIVIITGCRFQYYGVITSLLCTKKPTAKKKKRRNERTTNKLADFQCFWSMFRFECFCRHFIFDCEQRITPMNKYLSCAICIFIWVEQRKRRTKCLKRDFD